MFVSPQWLRWGLVSSGLLAGLCTRLHAEPAPRVEIPPDPPVRREPPAVGVTGLPDSASLDGWYAWLGPTGAAGRIDGVWDSAFGADLAVLRVREGAPLAVVGAAVGGSLWTERDGGRVYLEAIAGTRLGGPRGWVAGVSAGPLIELAEAAHPRLGGAVGVWMFAGVTPFARVGVVADLGAFAEVGIHLALPVFRH